MFGITTFRVVTTRPVTTAECDWLRADIPAGTLLEVRPDPYNIITEHGVAVGYVHEQHYFEIPSEAVLAIDEAASAGL
jgi:hypothetical protein